MGLPKYTSAWVLSSQDGISSLNYVEHLDLPALKEDEVLVQIYAASLNHRDLMITKVTRSLFDLSKTKRPLRAT